MNFINLAHGAFAMAGGYVDGAAAATSAGRALPGLPAVGLRRSPALLGAVLERTLYRPMYGKPHLDQVLFSIGLAFMAVAAVDYVVGLAAAERAAARRGCKGRTEFGDGAWMLGMGHYRLFIIVVCALLAPAAAGDAHHGRASAAGCALPVDDPRVAAGLGINVNRVFLVTFAVGSGLAGLGGALGAEILGLDPTFPLKFMVYFLIVVRGRRHHVTSPGPLLAALAAGHCRRGGQVLRAQAGRLHRLRADDRDPAVAPARPVRAPRAASG
jgi:branched-chain amino acid transport system permease protein